MPRDCARGSGARSPRTREGRPSALVLHLARRSPRARGAPSRRGPRGGGIRVPLALGDGPLLSNPAVGDTRGQPDARGVRDARVPRGGDRTAFAGKRVAAAYPLSTPLPLSRPRPAILIGGTGPQRTLRLVARYADAWNLITRPERVAAHRARLTERCAAIGRDVGEIE